MTRSNSKKRARPAMPAHMLAAAETAIVRHMQRGWVPDFEMTEAGWRSPYAPRHARHWEALMFELFGTRSIAVVNTFCRQLSELVGTRFDHKKDEWVLDDAAFRAALSLFQALKPQNEAQAAHVALMVALHISTMKLASGPAVTQWGGDARSVAVMAKSLRAFGDGMETLRRVQGKRRKTVQKIEVHHHQHQHVHFEGEAQFGGRPHGTPDCGLPALPSEGEVRETVPISCSEGQASLPDAWRGARERRANGRG